MEKSRARKPREAIFLLKEELEKSGNADLMMTTFILLLKYTGDAEHPVCVAGPADLL
jgi:hypothetical protein